jgi:hypothetical protein
MIPECLKPIAPFAQRVEPMGSRVVCNPAPTNTDADYILLVKPTDCSTVLRVMDDNGWVSGGSLIIPDGETISLKHKFKSFRFGEVNAVITNSKEYFDKCMLATAVSKHLNLLQKDDRIVVFHAIVFGESPEEKTSFVSY